MMPGGWAAPISGIYLSLLERFVFTRRGDRDRERRQTPLIVYPNRAADYMFRGIDSSQPHHNLIPIATSIMFCCCLVYKRETLLWMTLFLWRCGPFSLFEMQLISLKTSFGHPDASHSENSHYLLEIILCTNPSSFFSLSNWKYSPFVGYSWLSFLEITQFFCSQP